MCETMPFGTLEGLDVPLIRLVEGDIRVELLPFGAAIRAISVPDRQGRPTDVCLGYDRLEDYRDYDACFGGNIGRCANRIGGAAFTLNGRTYHLTANEGRNQLHGGKVGFHKKLWRFTCAPGGKSPTSSRKSVPSSASSICPSLPSLRAPENEPGA